MPVYTYECDGCTHQSSIDLPIELRDLYANCAHLECAYAGHFKRVYGFHFARSMPAHFSDQLNSYVTSERDFQSQLRAQADVASARMGFDVSYETVDPTDPTSAGVTDVGLESQERAHHDAQSDGHKRVFT